MRKFSGNTIQICGIIKTLDLPNDDKILIRSALLLKLLMEGCPLN